jgi:hypothetical protein
MTGRLVASVLATVFVCLSQAAPAQAINGGSDPDAALQGEPTAEVARMDATLRATVSCVFKREPSRVRAMLKTAPGSKQEANRLSSFEPALYRCNESLQKIDFSQSLLRGVFAETAYHDEFPNGFETETPWPADKAFAWSEPRLRQGGDQQLELLHSAARCLVAARPVTIRDLLASEPLSETEREAMRTLEEPLGPCLFKGIRVTASRQSLRGLLAEAALEYGKGSSPS